MSFRVGADRKRYAVQPSGFHKPMELQEFLNEYPDRASREDAVERFQLSASRDGIIRGNSNLLDTLKGMDIKDADALVKQAMFEYTGGRTDSNNITDWNYRNKISGENIRIWERNGKVTNVLRDSLREELGANDR